jgi:hypothetical protein
MTIHIGVIDVIILLSSFATVKLQNLIVALHHNQYVKQLFIILRTEVFSHEHIILLLLIDRSGNMIVR